MPVRLLLCVADDDATTVTTTTTSSAAEAEELPLRELRLFTEVFGEIKRQYVDVADDGALLGDAVRGMLAGLDPHSAFLDAEEFREMQLSSEGKFHGLGLEITTEDGNIKVIAPIDDTPAARAGIRAGDVLIMIDGVAVQGMRLGDAVGRLRGAVGSEVVLTIARDGVDEVFDVPLVRAVIAIVEVKGELLESGFGYVRVGSFQRHTDANLRRVIARLRRENGGELDGLVLDLRNNPGGVLYGAVAVSDGFLDDGVIVKTRGRGADAEQSFHAAAGDWLHGAPLIVLVNGGSASAAEIVAGALQDHRRAIILGTRTYGKGSVQTIIPVRGGNALKLTTARYYTPADRSIQARGIVPDIVAAEREIAVADDPADDDRTLREADLAGHLAGDDDGYGDDDATTTSDLAARDYQVGEALNLLKGMRLMRLRSDKVAPATKVSDDDNDADSAGEG